MRQSTKWTKWLAVAAAGLAVALGSTGDAHAGKGMVIHACASCESEPGGTGTAMLSHARAQLQLGYDVAVVVIDFAGQRRKADTLDDLIAKGESKQLEAVGEPRDFGSYVETTIRRKDNQATLYVFRISAKGVSEDQEANIDASRGEAAGALDGAIGGIVNEIFENAKTKEEPVMALQLHFYWNMSLERALAQKVHAECSAFAADKQKAPTVGCVKTAVILYPHSDELTYAGKLDGSSDDLQTNKGKGSLRANILLKDAISYSDAVFALTWAQQDRLLQRTDHTLAKITNEDVSSLEVDASAWNPKNKPVTVTFHVVRPELCDPVNNTVACTGELKPIFPVFNGIVDVVDSQDLQQKKLAPPSARRAALLAKKDYRERPLVIPDAEPVVMFIGRITKTKNEIFLVRSWSSIQAKCQCPAHLVLIGPREANNDTDYNELTDAVEQNPKFVHYLGPVAKSETPALYGSADVYASASLGEVSGMSVGEAMGSGAPIVAHGWPGAEDLVRNGTGFISDAVTAPADFIDKVTMLLKLTDDARWNDYGKNSAAVAANYTYATIAQRADLAIRAAFARVNGQPMPDLSSLKAK